MDTYVFKLYDKNMLELHTSGVYHLKTFQLHDKNFVLTRNNVTFEISRNNPDIAAIYWETTGMWEVYRPSLQFIII